MRQCPSSSDGCRNGYDVVSRVFVNLIGIVCERRRTNGAQQIHSARFDLYRDGCGLTDYQTRGSLIRNDAPP